MENGTKGTPFNGLVVVPLFWISFWGETNQFWNLFIKGSGLLLRRKDGCFFELGENPSLEDRCLVS